MCLYKSNNDQDDDGYESSDTGAMEIDISQETTKQRPIFIEPLGIQCITPPNILEKMRKLRITYIEKKYDKYDKFKYSL